MTVMLLLNSSCIPIYSRKMQRKLTQTHCHPSSSSLSLKLFEANAIKLYQKLMTNFCAMQQRSKFSNANTAQNDVNKLIDHFISYAIAIATHTRVRLCQFNSHVRKYNRIYFGYKSRLLACNYRNASQIELLPREMRFA